jgi:hypothetical protein
VNADGAEHSPVEDAGMMATSAGLRYLAWSPDGTRLTFEMGFSPYSTTSSAPMAQGSHA